MDGNEARKELAEVITELEQATTTLIGDLYSASQCHSAFVEAGEIARLAKNQATARRVQDRSLGNNEHVRQEQLDSDCSSERQAEIDTHLAYIASLGEAQASQARVAMLKAKTYALTALVNQ